MQTPISTWALATAAALLMSACGGGGDEPPASAATTVVAEQAAGPRAKALAVSSGGVVTPDEAARQLMDFGEGQFPGYFPSHQPTAAYEPFAYRYYPQTDTYLGVVMAAGAGYILDGVYVMGGAFGTSPQYVGQLTDFITPLPPGFEATLASDKAVVLQGGSTTVRVNLTRLRGFQGAVQVTLSGLPAGVTAPLVTIAADATSVDVPISAQPGAPHSLPTTGTVSVSAGTLLAEEPLTVTVRGLPGVVDTSFGGGPVTTPVGAGEDYANAVAVQADGKVIVAGTAATNAGTFIALVRYQRDGAVDPSFGIAGKVVTQVGANSDVATALAVQADGRIVVAGHTTQAASGQDFLLLRYRADGTLDPSFAQGGILVVPIGVEGDRAFAVAIQDDGKIVAAGESQTGVNTTGQDFALVRVLPDGTLDAGFGNGGKVVTPIKSAGGRDVVYALALPVVNGEQRILAVGGEGDFLAARYTAGGALDAGFGNGGKVHGLFGSTIGGARGVALLPDGRALLAGGIHNDFAAVQLTAAGTPDAGFGTGGRFVHAVSAGNWDGANAVARQADGQWVLGGWAYSGNSSASDFVALRLSAAGTLDASFGADGIAIHPVAAGTRNDQPHGLVLQADERVPTVRAIQAGEASAGNHDFALIRLWL